MSRVLLVVAALTLLGAAIALRLVVGSSSAGRAPDPPKQGSSMSAEPGGAATPHATAAPQMPAIPAPRLAKDVQPSGSSGGSGSDKPADTEPPELKSFRKSLSAQVSLTEPAILECIEKSQKAGHDPDGLGAFRFTLVRKGTKVVVAETGIEYASYGDPAIGDCFRVAANQMQFDSLPDGADEVVAYRKLGIKNAKIYDHWMTEYAITKGPAAKPPAP